MHVVDVQVILWRDQTCSLWEDIPHVWHHFALILPQAPQAIARIDVFVHRHVAGRPQPSTRPPDAAYPLIRRHSHIPPVEISAPCRRVFSAMSRGRTKRLMNSAGKSGGAPLSGPMKAGSWSSFGCSANA
jgi:hypothetical protein